MPPQKSAALRFSGRRSPAWLRVEVHASNDEFITWLTKEWSRPNELVELIAPRGNLRVLMLCQVVGVRRATEPGLLEIHGRILDLAEPDDTGAFG